MRYDLAVARLVRRGGEEKGVQTNGSVAAGCDLRSHIKGRATWTSVAVCFVIRIGAIDAPLYMKLIEGEFVSAIPSRDVMYLEAVTVTSPAVVATSWSL